MDKANEAFQNYVYSLPVKQYFEFIKKVKEECMVSKMAVYNWINGRTGIKPIYKKVICEIIGENIFK